MGFYHGNYEVRYKAAKSAVVSWDKESEYKIVVEAENLSDARRQAEKQLKNMGYKAIYIPLYGVTLLKKTFKTQTEEKFQENDNQTITSNVKTSNKVSGDTLSASTINKKVLVFILLGIIAVVLLISFFVIQSMKVDGTYQLVKISGNYQIDANYYDNYIVLDDGKCTLYLDLIEPNGTSIHTYYYTGDLVTNIEFEKSFISMNFEDQIEVRFDYGNGKYNIFTYEKNDK